ncbi:hypothetical protein [Pedobacter sp. MR2016-24]|uniref:hypothetical protein n=1 Tax=Pedobacter sp. MR2016-24 TaxID=2994466 RepID=UPI002245E52A|nr:hypothetical protein [Pedobacter sp. MR2016-24]MCX2484863.1 hypothetical protein [Pedobacter sp. MR2016-24]
MQVYHFKLPSSKQELIIVAPIQEEEEYLVTWQGQELGYIYPTFILESCRLLWEGNNDMLKLIAPKLGEFIETAQHSG